MDLPETSCRHLELPCPGSTSDALSDDGNCTARNRHHDRTTGIASTGARDNIDRANPGPGAVNTPVASTLGSAIGHSTIGTTS